MNTLSVCMIVKNEEMVLDRCLKCVRQFADEIVIVDTGSTDRTIEIAKKYTKNVFCFEWQNDFSSARNYSISLAHGNYIMWIDADDTIDKKNIKKLQQLKENLQYETYMLKYVVAFDSNGAPTFEFFRERILKNCANCRFCGFVHEAIAPFGRVEYEDIAIEHHKIEKKRNTKRNLNLYRYQQKLGKKFGARDMFYFGRELVYNGYIKKAIATFKKFLKMPNKFLPNVIDAYNLLCDCYLSLNNVEVAKNMLVESMKIATPNAQCCCKMGYLHIKQTNVDDAIFWYKCALNCKNAEKSGQFVQNDYIKFIPYLQLSFCYYQKGDKENFKKYHNLAKSIKPYDKAVLHNEQFAK